MIIKVFERVPPRSYVTEVVQKTRLLTVLEARVSYCIHQEGSEDELWLESNSIVPGDIITVTAFESRSLLASSL